MLGSPSCVGVTCLQPPAIQLTSQIAGDNIRSDFTGLSPRCLLLEPRSSTWYYRPRALGPDELALMRRLDELYAAYLFCGRCWRACKTAQSWASKMAHPRAGRELRFLAGARARRLEDSGTVASSLNEGGAMHGSDKRVLVRHYLRQGVGKAEIARRLKIGRRTVYNWIAGGKLDKVECESEYGPRPPRPSKLDPFKGIIQARLEDYPQLSAVRLPDEIKAAGYTGGCDQVKRHVRLVRPREPADPVVRFETAPDH